MIALAIADADWRLKSFMVKKRCGWVGADSPLMLEYHDREWGVPVHDDVKHFEFLVLEGAQAGLSWSPPTEKNRPNLGNRRLNVPAVYIMPNWDIASMLLRFQGAPILTLTRLFRLCFSGGQRPPLQFKEFK